MRGTERITGSWRAGRRGRRRGGAAERRAEGARVPLVLADQWMPGRTGTEFLAQVRDPYLPPPGLLL